MNRILLFLFITISIYSQDEITIEIFDTTEDYYKALYEIKIEKDTKNFFKKDFILKKPIFIRYKHNKTEKLLKIHEVDYKSYDNIQYRGIIIYGMYYLFPILDYYQFKHDWNNEVFFCDVYHIDSETIPNRLKCSKCKENIIINKKIIKEICKCKKNWKKIIYFIKKKAQLSISSINKKFICYKKIELYKGKLAKIIKFYEPYGNYDLKERYIFTIILEE
jgi:hypothetical protein